MHVSCVSYFSNNQFVSGHRTSETFPYFFDLSHFNVYTFQNRIIYLMDAMFVTPEGADILGLQVFYEIAWQSEGIRLQPFRNSFVHAQLLPRDVLFTKSTIYRPARIFQTWSQENKINQYHTHIDFVILYQYQSPVKDRVKPKTL